MGRKQYALTIAYGQSMIALLVILNVFYPQYLSYTFIVFIVAMVIFTAITMRTQLKHIVGKEAKEIKEGRRLFSMDSKDVMTIQSTDTQVINELKPMFKATMISFLSLIVLFAWYPLYFGYARSIVSAEGVNVLTKVLVFLAGYEIPYALFMIINRLTQRSLREIVQVVTKYEVYDKGIVGTGITIKFPLNNNYSIKVNSRRKFMDIIMSRGRVKVRYRFYTKNLTRLIDIVKRYGNPKKVEFER